MGKNNPETMKAWRKANPKKVRASRLRYLYGVEPEVYDELWSLQEGLCAICKNPETRIIRGTLSQLAVDHNHVTGEIRGLLCSDCNLGLGKFHDDAMLLQAALDYLKEDF